MKSHQLSFEKEIHKEVAKQFLDLDPDALELGLSVLAKELVEMWEDSGVQKAFMIIEEKTPLWNLAYFVEKLPDWLENKTFSTGDADYATSDQSSGLNISEKWDLFLSRSFVIWSTE